MFSEDDVVAHVDNIHDVVGIVCYQKLKDLEFDSCLVVVLFLVFDYLHTDLLARLVVETLQCSAERALAKKALNFPAVANVVINDNLEIAVFFIEAIVFVCLFIALYFGGDV